MREFQECLNQAEPSGVNEVCVSPQCGEGSMQGKIVEVWDDTHVDVNFVDYSPFSDKKKKNRVQPFITIS